MNRYIVPVTFVILVVTLFVLSFSPSFDSLDTKHSSTQLSQNNNDVEEKSDVTAGAALPSTKPSSFSPLADRLTEFAELPSVAQAPKTLPDALESFNQWRKQKPANNNLDELKAWQANGVPLAQVRQTEMQRLMRQHPEYAITQALSFPDYAALPDEVKAHVEQPFSATVNFDVLPQESKQAFHLANNSYIRVDDQSATSSNNPPKQHWQTYRYGSRETILSKRNIVVQGIRLGDEAVINEQAVMPIAASDVAYFKQSFPLAEKHQSAQGLRDFYTDEVISGEPQFGLAGGKLLAFSSEENIQQLNEQLAALEQKNHPNYSSALVFEERSARLMSRVSPSASQTVDNNVPLAQQLTQLLAVPSDWTTSVKKVLLIRTKPSDATDPAITQADLETALNNSSDLIVKLSQHKTSLNSTVSSQAFTLSQTASHYASSNASVVLDEAKQLFSAANPNVDLTSYDIVGVHIGGKRLPVDWAGLASVGGGNYWLNNTKSLGVVTHEFGHIYGLGHSNFWETNNASVVGSGSNDEYGDIYDIMGGGGAPEGYFHPQALEKIDWLTPTDWEEVTTSGTYRIYRFDDENASGKRGLRISRNNAVDGYYWLGHRQNFDNNTTLENGAYLLWQRPNETKSWLVDTTPGSFADNKDDKQDAGIKLGQTYSDNAANIHITTLAKGGTAPNEWLDIQINLGNASNQAPTVSLTLPNTLTARTALTFTASASDSDGDTLAYEWDFGDGVVHPSQASVTQSWVVGGSYTVKVTVSDMKGGTATAQQTITVSDPLTQWSSRTSPITNHIVDIAANDTMAVAITDHAVLGSNDGQTWTKLDERRDGDTGLGYNTYLKGIAYDKPNQQWIAVGQDHNGGWVGTIYTSPDGTNWTERYQGGKQLQAIASSGSALVAVGSGGDAVRSSDGGATWSPVSTGISTTLIDISYGNGQFIAVGNAYIQGHEAAVLTSSDGQSWSNQTSNSGSGTRHGFHRIAYLNNQFIAAGYNGKLSYLTNTAGINFVTTRDNREPMNALMHGAGVYFAAGVSQDNGGSDIDLISLNGQTWTESPLNSDLDNRNAGVFFKNTFLTVGKNGSIRQSDPITPVVAPVDSDGDGVSDATDNCPNNANTDQADADNDGVGDVCDTTSNGADSDGDTIPDATDNCPNDANTDQADLDNDNIGDVCDDDRDGDGVNNSNDAFPDDSAEQTDTDGDGIGNNADDDDDGDAIPDLWESANGLDSLDASDANLDRNNDGINNLNEYFQSITTIWRPTPNTTWQWQLKDTIDTSFDVEMYDIDLFDTPQATINQLKAEGRKIVCYFSAGSYENWRSDAADFPASVLGNDLSGWAGEKWLDIRALNQLSPIMRQRLDLAVSKGCDGVEPDNIDAYQNNSGFPLTANDQLAYNQWLSVEAHKRGLSIGLKNDLGQVNELLQYFDWAINEECYQYNECDDLIPFINANKAVFGVEYQGAIADFCPKANQAQFSWLYKNLALDAQRFSCNDYRVPSNQQPTSILLPLYKYPSHYNVDDYIWDDVAAAQSQVNITAIINPSNGSGGVAPNSDYQVGMTALRDAGVTMLGYVATCWANSEQSASCYNTRTLDSMKADIKTYADHFDIQGIFFDEAATNAAQVNDYQELSNYARSLGLQRIVVNPGTATDQAYVDQDIVANTAVTFESPYAEWQQTTPPTDWTQTLPARQSAALVYNVPENAMVAVVDEILARNYGYLYVTDDGVDGNPWDSLPSYWSGLLDYLADPNADSDGDTIPDATDNCPNDANTDQADADNDGQGDVCDTPSNGTDTDNDTIPDVSDNCPNDANTNQADLDNDTIGDVCDNDRDGDTINNNVDNCPDYNNTNQMDSDNDGQGDVCDSTSQGDDSDSDTIPDVTDNCPNDANVYQEDSDGDGQGDVCDTDRDGDTVNNDVDNCPDHINLDQADTDGDGQGDTCDSTSNGIDSDNDTIPDATDNCPLNPNLDQADSDGDGDGDVCDIDSPPDIGTGVLEALVDITDDWGTGFCANVNVHNTSNQIVDWSTQFDPQGQIYTIWSAFTSAPDANGLITAEGMQYNNTLAPNESANFGYCAERTSDPNNTTELTVDVDYSDSWQTGYCATAWLQNDQDNVVDWTTTINLPADKQGTVTTMWGANYTENNGSLSIEGEAWNNWLLPNQYTFFGFCVALDSVSGSDTTAPAVTAPANLTGQAALKSKAFLTAFALSDLGVANATDDVDGEVNATLLSVNGDPVQIENNRILLRPGRNSVIWQAEDSAGNRGLAEQTVDVLPRANFIVNQSSSEGRTVTVEAWLNGDAPSYPVEIPFTLHHNSTADSDDYTASAHKIVIEQLQASDSQTNPSGAVTVNLLADGNDAEATETLIFAMNTTQLVNAVAGKKRRHKIKILNENKPPKVKLKITQGEKKGRFVVQGNGHVTVNAVAKDPNGDSLTYAWTANGLTDIPETPNDNPATFVFDPASASTGRHKVSVMVDDGQASVRKKKRVKIQAAEVIVDNNADTDGDNILDKDELGDENGNGIPDYLEPPHDHHELPSDDNTMLSGEPGSNLGLGDIAFDSDGSSCSVSEQQISDYLVNQGLPPYQPESQYNTEKIFDYTIAGLEEAGASSQIMLTLPTALTAQSVIRKYNITTGQWSAFVEDANNQLETYISNDGNCTDDEDTVWQSGLVVGASCLRLTIEDGGANDADGEANGEIDDPVAIASETTTTDTGGGSGGSDDSGNTGGDSGGSGNTGGNSGSDDNTTVTTETPTAKVSIVEGDGANTINYFQLAISEPLSVDASVAYTTRSGTAKSGEDYVASSGIATIPAGETKALIAVEIIADNLVEGNETFSLVIVNPVGGVFPEDVSEVVATHTIIDDD